MRSRVRFGVAIDLDSLRRYPDVEAPGLRASDAADRLILDEAAAALAEAAGETGAVVVVDDAYGALALGAVDAGARDVRVHQDPITGERALAANAERLGVPVADRPRSLPLEPGLVTGARVVLARLPRSLDRLDEVAGLIAAHAAPGVRVFAGGRLKHMTPAMNDVLRRWFARVDVSHARQKSRVLIAAGAREAAARAADPRPTPGLTRPATLALNPTAPKQHHDPPNRKPHGRRYDRRVCRTGKIRILHGCPGIDDLVDFMYIGRFRPANGRKPGVAAYRSGYGRR
jgi:16S rRNA (guanine1207-N2)-methyltransferase